MKKILLILLVLSILLTLMFVTMSAEETLVIGFDNAEAECGETVSLQLSIKNNPGIAAILVSLKYDENVLTLTETKRGSLFSGFTAARNFAWDSSKNVTKDGVLATFTFAVADNAAPGEYEIEVIVRECINEDYDAVDCGVQNGKIVVKGEPKPAETTGVCGDNLTWALDLASGTLTISGTGNMYDYNGTNAPWHSSKDSIKTVIINKGVTSIGTAAFEDCSSLNTVRYEGQKSDWDKIIVGERNTPLTKADILFTCSDHNYEWVVDNNETCGVNGVKHEECSVCHAKRNENTEIPATGNHTYVDSWSADKDGHWHTCSVCDAKGEVATHIAGPEATDDTPQLCTVCGYEIAPAKAHEHKYEGDYIADADGHYQNCSCGEAGQKEAHTFDKGSVVKEPTADTAGEKHYTCETCGYVKTEEFNLDDKEASEITPDNDSENSIFTTTFIVVVVVLGAVVISVIVFFIIKKNKKV